MFNPILTLCQHTVPKGGWEPSDRHLEAAASREALEEGPTFVPLFVSPPPDFLPSSSLLLPCPCGRLSSNSGCTRYYHAVCHHDIDSLSNVSFL